MRLLALGIVAALPAATAAAPAPQSDAVTAPFDAGEMPVLDPTPGTDARCPPISRYHAMRQGGPLVAEKLAELPLADHYKAVYRRIGDCEAPVIVGFGIGGR